MSTQAKVTPRQVAAYQSLRAVTVDAAATCGAQIGVNLLLPDGSVGTLAQLQALFGATATATDSGISTTDDLEEGQFHEWFTDRRAQDAVGSIAGNSANVTLSYTGGTSLVADLTDLADSGAGTLLALTRDAKGRITGTRAATITGTAGRVTVDHGDASAGVPTIDLATVADTGGGALLRFVRDAWGRITGTSAATTDDLTEGSRLYYTDARADARIAAQKAAANGLATLDSSGKLDASQLPALAISETFVVNTQADMLALTAQQGDVAVRTDLSKSFILAGTNPATLSDWQELLTPTGGVASFNGRTGSVTPSAGDYTFALIGSTPTTLLGYGITDAVPAARTINGKALNANVTLAAADVSAEPAISAGTTAQYWRGDKGWRDFATDVRAAVLTGLSTATSAVIAATDTVLGALGKLQAQITDNLLPPGYIDGLQLVWVSSTAVTVKSGAAYIQGSSKVLRSTSDIAKAGLSLTASSWYHVYLYNNSGTPAVEIVTTAPASPYNGSARSKTGDTSRRYVGSVRTDASGNVIRFDHSLANGSVYYLTNINNAPLHPLHLGIATTSTIVDLSSAIPPTSRRAIAYAENSNTGGAGGSIAFISAPPLDPLVDVITFLRSTSYVPGTYLTDSAQRINYAFNGATAAGTGLDIWILGYEYER